MLPAHSSRRTRSSACARRCIARAAFSLRAVQQLRRQLSGPPARDDARDDGDGRAVADPDRRAAPAAFARSRASRGCSRVDRIAVDAFAGINACVGTSLYQLRADDVRSTCSATFPLPGRDSGRGTFRSEESEQKYPKRLGCRTRRVNDGAPSRRDRAETPAARGSPVSSSCVLLVLCVFLWHSVVRIAAPHAQLRVRHRPPKMHRMPRLHDRLQGRARDSGRRESLLGEDGRERHVPRHAPLLLPGPLQSVRRRAVRAHLPDQRALQAPRRHRRSARRLAASAAAPAWRRARTISCSSIRTRTPPRSATSARTASRTSCCRRA